MLISEEPKAIVWHNIKSFYYETVLELAASSGSISSSWRSTQGGIQLMLHYHILEQEDRASRSRSCPVPPVSWLTTINLQEGTLRLKITQFPPYMAGQMLILTDPGNIALTKRYLLN